MKINTILLAIFTAFATSSVMAAATCPADLDKTSCVYFKEGYAAGVDDKKAKQDNNYHRYDDSFDSRYEKAFAKGYSQGYTETK